MTTTSNQWSRVLWTISDCTLQLHDDVPLSCVVLSCATERGENRAQVVNTDQRCAIGNPSSKNAAESKQNETIGNSGSFVLGGCCGGCDLPFLPCMTLESGIKSDGTKY